MRGGRDPLLARGANPREHQDVRVAEEWTPDNATFAYVDLSAFIAASGVLIIWAGWAAARGRLKRNYVIGMRTGTIMRTDATWRAAHKKCAWSFWSSGLVMVATSARNLRLAPTAAVDIGSLDLDEFLPVGGRPHRVRSGGQGSAHREIGATRDRAEAPL